MKRVVTLGEFIIKKQAEFPYASGELTGLLSGLRLAAKLVNSEINKAGLVDFILGSSDAENVQGEQQQKLDVYANKIFIEALEARDEVCGIASEEEDSFIPFQREACKNGKYVVLIDPLDGSSNIDVNVSIGTIFSIYRRISPIGTEALLKDFLQPGHKQVAAGYIIYGSSTMMVYTTGHGVNGFTFDPAIGVFFLSHPDISTPSHGPYYSINEGYYQKFPNAIKQYIKQCQRRNPPLSARYIGSLVSDFHRNLIKGGIYLYPPSATHRNGKLRLLYECNPIAFLTEQAGGKAISNDQRIMDIQPTELHQRTPFYVGSADMVNDLINLFSNQLITLHPTDP